MVVRVPGVVRFLGAFSEYYKGFSLCAADSRELKVTVSFRADSQIKVYNSFLNDRKHFTVTSLKYRKEDRWSNYIKAILHEINTDATIRGMNISLCGDMLESDNRMICVAACLGVELALNKIYELNFNNTRILHDVYQACNIFCGEKVDYMTILTMMNAEEDRFLFFNNEKSNYTYLDNIFKSSDYRLYLIDSKIPPASMVEELEDIHDSIKAASAVLRSSFSSASIRNLSVTDINDRSTPLSEEERRISSFLLEEYRTVSTMDRLFSQKDYLLIGKAFTRTGKGIRDSLELTCPEIDWISKRCAEISACQGTCVAFCGKGGVIAVLLKEGAAEKIQSRLEEYERIFGFRPTFLEFKPERRVEIR
ncbi:MAG: hypothetical protein K5634_03775 [Sphaerochaetaceae bacterium]|nr:hypothetical protein [Sphaerochaetaceae bacterium]